MFTASIGELGQVFHVVIVPSLVALLCRIYKTASFMCFVVMCLNSSRNFRDKEFALVNVMKIRVAMYVS